jgi:uncharacterized protein YqeY
MAFKEKILNDFKEAFKGKDEIRLSALKMLQAEIRNSEIAKRTNLAKGGESDLGKKSQLNDGEVLKVISSEIKKRKKAIEFYEKGGRADLASKEKKEVEVLSAYLPNL